jgi:hypothetical protein
MPGHPCIVSMSSIRAAGEPDQRDIVLPAAEQAIWKIERRREAGRRGRGLDEDIDDLVAQQSLPKTAYL